MSGAEFVESVSVVAARAEALKLRALWRLAAATTLVVLGFASVNPVLAVELARRGTSATAIGVFAMLNFVTVALALPWLPRVFERVGATRAYRYGLVVEVLCTCGYAAGDGYLWWCACSVLGAAGSAAVWNGTEAMIAFNAPAASRGRVTGLYQTALGAALALGPFVPGLWLLWAPSLTPQALVVCVALSSAALLMLALAMVAGPMLRRLPVATAQASGQTLWTALRARPALVWIAFAGGVFEIGLGSISAAHGSQLGLSVAAATSIAGALGAGSFLLQYPAGWLADRVAVRKVLTAAGAMLVAASMSLAFSASWPVLLWATAFVWGAVGGAIYTLTMVRVAHDFARTSAMAGAAAMITGYTLGGAAGPALSGLMFDRYGVLGQSVWLSVLAGTVVVVSWRCR